MKDRPFVFGIDFGTTNSALSVYWDDIQALFAARFGRDKLENRDAFTSVVHGLGLSAPLFI